MATWHNWENSVAYELSLPYLVYSLKRSCWDALFPVNLADKFRIKLKS